MLQRLLENHILANLIFVLVVATGLLTYLNLPRQKDPTVNLNWISVTTILPGASAVDVENKVTNILEEALAKVSDIRFITSTSRPNISNILIRFNEIDQQTFEKRITDLRREIQNKYRELPNEAEAPEIVEATSSNAYPAAFVLVVGVAADENLRKQTQYVKKDFEHFRDIERVDAIGVHDPELQVLFEPTKLLGLGVSPSILADTVTAYFRDVAAGSVGLGDQEWLVRLTGTDNNPQYLAELPILSPHGEVPLRSVAQVVRGREKANQLVQYAGQPAVMLTLYKKTDVNVLQLMEKINHYISTFNERSTATTGIQLVLLDDQTATTKDALAVMEREASYGLILVLLITWLLLGGRLALVTSISIPFTLAGTFWFLSMIGQTLNVIVLLGIVIALGIFVDNSIVVAEFIYSRLQRGMAPAQAAAEGLREALAPITAAVLTMVAGFLPLMLMPGVLGDFMLVVPIVITTTLLVSLVDAFWILPSHIIEWNIKINRTSHWQLLRETLTRRLEIRFVRGLILALRWPVLTYCFIVLLMVAAVGVLITGLVRVELFASDFARLVYVNVEMPIGTRLEKTLETSVAVEQVVKAHLLPEELRSTATYAGLRFTDKEPLFGDHNGQVLVSLQPPTPLGRTINQIIDDMRDSVNQVPGPMKISFQRISTGAPPTLKPISIKIRGDEQKEIRQAADEVIRILQDLPAVHDITDDDVEGSLELSVRLNPDAIVRAGLNPATVVRDIRLLTDGEIVASMQDRGEKLEVRVRARPETLKNVENFLQNAISLPDGRVTPISQLLHYEIVRGKASIRHYNQQRTITIESELNKELMDTLAVNQWVQAQCSEKFAKAFPNISLEFSGEMDDIKESLDALGVLFLLGVGLIYIILGTQFKSYIQPFIIIFTIPLAFMGVVFGLLFSGDPLNIYTMYSVVALAGVAVTSAIVLISAANELTQRGVSVLHATVYAARRRFMPIVITCLTTIAALFAVAGGWGGTQSLIWGPVATANIWGFAISTVLTLFVIPLLYSHIVKNQSLKMTALPLPRPLQENAGSWFNRLLTNLRVGLLTGTSRTEQYEALEAIEVDPELRALYNDGRRMLLEKEYEQAIRIYDKAIREAPHNSIFYVCAVQALIVYMREQIGWDIGYMERAKRYLTQASRLAPGDKRIPLLQSAYNQLDLTQVQ